MMGTMRLDKFLGITGMSSRSEAKKLLDTYGENILEKHKKTPAFLLFLGQFADVVISGIADYLLEEGALFPPVKIGQTVYAVLDEDEVLL